MELDSTYKWDNAGFFFLCVWLISLSVMPSRFIHVVAYGRISLFLRLNNIPLCVCVCVCVSQFLYPFTEGHSGCLSWVMLQWTWECKYLFVVLISFSLGIYTEVGLLKYVKAESRIVVTGGDVGSRVQSCSYIRWRDLMYSMMTKVNNNVLNTGNLLKFTWICKFQVLSSHTKKR